mmetsp:Transcript_14734/g.23965  ORF Transcript_14734/g.23965 Transcript_14734/m.23965 type:complete len:458 (-) Transcript_14734:35-1408(-)
MSHVVIGNGDVQGLIAALVSANEGNKSPEESETVQEYVIELALNGSYPVGKCFQAGNGFPVLNKDTRVRIIGNGAEIYRGSPGRKVGVPEVRFWTVHGALEICGLSLSQGSIRGGCGGAFYVGRGGNLKLENCSIRGCSVTGLDGEPGEQGAAGGGGGQGVAGGAVFSNGGTVILEQCCITDNVARGGNGGASSYHHGKYVGEGGLGGGGVNMFMSGGKGGRASGLKGGDGVDGMFGGGGGGGGANHIGNEEGVAVPGKAGFGGGNGGHCANGSGSGGGGGAGFGGGIACVEGGVISITDCQIRNNEAIGGTGGRHEWGWPSGYCGLGCGGGVFVWKLEKNNVHIDDFFSPRISFNSADCESNIYELNRVKECHVSQHALSKRSLLDILGSLSITTQVPVAEKKSPIPGDERVERGPEYDPEQRIVKTVEKTSKLHLPVHLVEDIIQEYVGWELENE